MTHRVRPVLSCALIVLTMMAAHRTSIAGDPMEPVRLWIEPGSASAAPGYYVDEMQLAPRQLTLGERRRSGVAAQTRIIARSDTSAVIGVTAVDDSIVTEYSCFVRLHEGTWKLAAVRTMPYLQEVRARRDALHAAAERSPEEDSELARLSLVVGSDDDIRAYVRANKDALQRIVDLYRARKVTQALKLAKTIFIVDIDEPADTASSRLELILGGMHDSVVGILYVPHPEDVPAMTPSDMILVEEVEPTFYVFRTM
ncbi:MAG: hypothetical protein FGM24_03840 [Candidatus Kapabacteria bacterium]|nr:hypothetical protein [Candidatus Kapabacteria bacterium]